MKIREKCVECLLNKQKSLSDNEEYLAEIRAILDNRKEEDSAPYMVYLFNKVYERYYGKRASYKEEKIKYNDIVLSMESELRDKIESSEDPLATSLLYARIGNYIDFGAMNEVNEEAFLDMFSMAGLSYADELTIRNFVEQCRKAKTFLLIADNCGEIVLDRIFLQELKKKFEGLEITVMVRGGEVLNDATLEDALYAGLDTCANIITNGLPLAGTVYEMLSDDAKHVIDESDIVLAKGQGNYETLSGIDRKIFYSFLCKCELFTDKFKVPRLTGMFIEE